MKRYLLLLPVLFLFQMTLSAQANYKKIQKAESREFSKKYDFERAQKAEFNVLLERKFTQLQEIESIRNSDPTTYRIKRRSIFEGMQASLRRMLSEEQKKVYERELKTNRLILAEKTKSLDNSEESKERIKDLKSGVRNY